MTRSIAKRFVEAAAICAAGAAILALPLGTTAAKADSKRSSIERQRDLDRTFQNSEDAADERSRVMRRTTRSQQNAILEQAERARQRQIQDQCRAAGIRC